MAANPDRQARPGARGGAPVVTNHRHAAIEAVIDALSHPPSGAGMTMAEWERARAEAAFEAALPHMLRIHAGHDRQVRAAQREADAQLAESTGAHYWRKTMSSDDPPQPYMAEEPFADLLRNPPEPAVPGPAGIPGEAG